MEVSSPGALVRELSRLFVRSQRAQSASVDIASNVQCHVLTELLRIEALTQDELAERLSLDKNWICKAVDSLVSDGVVSKLAQATPSQGIKITLTPLGRIRADKLEATLNQHAAAAFEHIPPEEHAKIQQSLQTLIQALKRCETEGTTD